MKGIFMNDDNHDDESQLRYDDLVSNLTTLNAACNDSANIANQILQDYKNPQKIKLSYEKALDELTRKLDIECNDSQSHKNHIEELQTKLGIALDEELQEELQDIKGRNAGSPHEKSGIKKE